MIFPLTSHTVGERVVYGKVIGTDPRSRPLYRLWQLSGVVVAPKTSEIRAGGDTSVGWLDVDRVTLHIPDVGMEITPDYVWFPFPSREGLRLFTGSKLETSDVKLFGDLYRAANPKSFVWKSPFTGQFFGTQLDVLSEKVA